MKYNTKKINILLIAIVALLYTNIYAQHGTGLLKDPEATAKVPVTAPIYEGGYRGLPPKASLQKYAPTPKNQGDYGTCVGWAVAYASRTILYAKEQNITDRTAIDNIALSPYFLYEKTKPSADIYCQDGTTLYRGLEEIRANGVAKFKDFNEICNQNITVSHINTAKKYRINTYKKLFVSAASKEQKIQVIKKSIAEGYPVVVGIECCNNSFLSIRGEEYWSPEANEEIPYGGHAVAVVAYDDEKYGGAVQIMNSWGTLWADGGFVWISYDVFADYCFEAYEMEPIETEPVVTKSLSGSIDLELSSGSKMPVQYKSFGYYETKEGYHSGTSFRIYLSNKEPAYVYVLGSDLSNKVFTIFPFNENITPYLNYKSNDIAIPDDSHYISLDNTKGMDYLCVLYAVKPLDIQKIKKGIEITQGTFAERVRSTLGLQLVNSSNVTYAPSSDRMFFRGNGTEKTVIPIIVGIKHL